MKAAETTTARWEEPPRTTNHEGEPRHVGIELEFAGLSSAEAARIVAREMGGEIEEENQHRHKVIGAELGDFTVELDFKYAHGGEPGDRLRRTIADLGATFLPMEVVCPPVTLADAPKLDRLREALRSSGAEGTRSHPMHAYGAQLNPDLPSLEPDYIRDSLRAFILLRDWLRDEIAIDPSRRIWPFAAPFPERYARMVLHAAYRPTMDELIDDYLHRNATRNREVDMLPLFAHIDEPRVRSVLPEETIKSRPTWHYRLPNADLEEAGWTLAREWNRWVAVERLADDKDLLRKGADRWIAHHESSIHGDWTPHSRELREAL